MWRRTQYSVLSTTVLSAQNFEPAFRNPHSVFPMGFLSFTAWQFALAGAICAAGPIIIHLLNRRRFRVVQWAAMDFLREAMQRNRRIVQIRDIILLVLRTAAVLLFGLALAQPFFASREEEFND